MSKKAWGGKVNNSHSTATDTAIQVINAAVGLKEVSKISLGIIKSINGSRRELKFLPIVGGTKAVVRGSGAVQELYIYTSDVEITEMMLWENFVDNRK